MKKLNATCGYCGNEVKNHKSVIKSHVKNCELIQAKAKNKEFGTSDYYLIKISAKYSPHWLVIKAHPNLLLTEIDSMLREGWLECCGHLSDFSITERGYHAGSFSKNAALADVFSAYPKINYTYDFGSSTELELELLDTVKMPNDGNLVLYLQNIAPEDRCAKCKKQQAEYICIDCLYSEEGDKKSAYCANCIEAHGHLPDNSNYDYAMSYVNSPRVGECAYEGPVDFRTYQPADYMIKPERKNRKRAKDILEEDDYGDEDMMAMFGGLSFFEEEDDDIGPEAFLQDPNIMNLINQVIMDGPGQVGLVLPHILKQTFSFYKAAADRTVAQLKHEQLFEKPNPHTHSVAALMKHIAIGMRSNYENWEDTEVGKYRLSEELEFSAEPKEWLKIKRNWDEAWTILFNEIDRSLHEGRLVELMDLGDGNEQPVWMRMILSLAHYNYHIGQIVQTAKMLSNEWPEKVFRVEE